MKILYHHRTQAEDGQAVHIRALIAAFRSQGHEVREVSLVRRDDAALPGSAAARPVEARSERYPWLAHVPGFVRELGELAYGPLTRGQLVRAGREFAPDFLYERYAFGNSAGVLAARALAKPLVLEVNSPMVLEHEKTRGLAFPGLARAVETRVFRAASLVCAVTGVLRDILCDLGVERERVLVTPNGVHLARYAAPGDPAARTAARASLALDGVSEDELVLGFVGFYRDWHRLDVVLDAMAEPRLARTRLVLVGEGPAREDLERRARELGLAARVHFAGAKPHGEIPALLPAFDVALVPAINPYASPLKLFEYMAAGLAIVAPDQPNLREVLQPDVDALLVPSGERALLVDVLVRLQERGLRTRLGAAARSAVERNDWTWEGNARRVVAAVGALR